MGDITIKLFTKETPKTVENFTTHSKNGYYNNTIFHRVIKDFMVQCGDPQGMSPFVCDILARLKAMVDIASDAL